MAIATVVMIGLVTVFVRNLPAPPRYDELTVEPGSTTPVMRGIVRRVHGAAGGELLTTAASDVALESWPDAADGDPATLVVFRIPVERADTTFAVIGVEGRDVEIVVRRGRSVVLDIADHEETVDAAAAAREPFAIESASIILPKGASDLEVEMRPRGDAPTARMWWREVEGGTGTAAVRTAPRRRPLSELLEETSSEG